MYEDRTYEAILERVLNRVPSTMDKREGSIIFDADAPASAELAIVYIEMDVIVKEAWADTASREYLIRRAKERGIIPIPANSAVVKGEFTPITLDVPIGHRFSCEEYDYVVTKRIQAGEYELTCETMGSAPNGIMGQLIPIDYVNGLATASITELLIPGEDEEGTEEIRQRYYDSFDRQAFGGNRKDYIEKTNALAGVGATKVKRAWNLDIRPADMIPTEAVTEWYNNLTGLPEEVKRWIDTIYLASSEKKLTVGGTVLLTILGADFNKAGESLLEFVQEEIDPQEMAGEGVGIAPIGHVVTVQTVNEVPINIEFTITFKTGYNWDSLKDSITNVISEYFLELKKNWEDEDELVVRVNQINSRIMLIEGVLDVEHTTLNGSDENITLGIYEIPKLGDVIND